MRLLTTNTPIPQLHVFPDTRNIPPYAILSHTWEHDEITLQELLQASFPSTTNNNIDTTAAADSSTATTTTPNHRLSQNIGLHGGPITPATPSSPISPVENAAVPLFARTGFLKIQRTCAVARVRDELAYAWVDTCCIDKTSSAELAEAINSMFAWYRDAAVCYVYLSDLPPPPRRRNRRDVRGEEDETTEEAPMESDRDRLARDLPRCRWFTRGWTLQELIAPREVVFFDREWNERGTKRELCELVSAASGVPWPLLVGKTSVEDYAVARRMSWAARRQTTRVEDRAYCLLGIFNVHLSLIYGEGEKAFARLQAAIVQSTPDLSIFAWADERPDAPLYSGVLADSPERFAMCGEVEFEVGDSAFANFSVTTRGIQSDASLLWVVLKPKEDEPKVVLATLSYLNGPNKKDIGIYLRKIGGGLYARCRPDMLVLVERRPKTAEIPLDGRRKTLVERLTLVTTLPTQLPIYACDGPNPVLGNRVSALRVNWGPLIVREALPRSHWDFDDGVFFGCHGVSRGWCAYFASGLLSLGSGPGTTVHLKLLLACFGWNNAEPQIILANLDQVSAEARVFLTAQLDNVVFEHSQQAFALIQDVFEGKLRLDTNIESGQLPARFVRTGGSWCSEFPDLELMLELRQEDHGAVCTNPVLVVDVKYRLPTDKGRHGLGRLSSSRWHRLGGWRKKMKDIGGTYTPDTPILVLSFMVLILSCIIYVWLSDSHASLPTLSRIS